MIVKEFVPDVNDIPLLIFKYGVIAGSYPAFKIGNMKDFGDIDVFLYDGVNESNLHSDMVEKFGLPVETINSYVYYREPSPNIAVMKKEKFTTTRDIFKLIRAFDVINIRVAIDGKHVFYQKKTLPNVLEVAKPKGLVCPLNTLFRLVKFAQRGYTIDYNALVNVLFAVFPNRELTSDGCFFEVE